MITFVGAVTTACSADNAQLLMETFYKQGFVVVDGSTLKSENKLSELAGILELGETFVSQYNKTYFPNKSNSDKVAEIGFNEENRDDFAHPVFEESGALGQHVDGTFSPLGEVKTTLLLCQNQAVSGGETTLFNGYGAIKYLESIDSKFVDALKDKNALRRRSTFDGINEEMTDCVFGLDSIYEREIIRLAFDSSADWESGYELVPNLKEAVERLMALYNEQGEFFLQFILNEGDVIVMDNTRITHGRTKFTHDLNNPRMMHRSVHQKLPLASMAKLSQAA
ncbi:TauD/TfdA family dioxygenase [Vibrio parahaemolyticus]|nr:TauD/TfdA family dioxygenase [Vibrio parahaemolyticus]